MVGVSGREEACEEGVFCGGIGEEGEVEVIEGCFEVRVGL